ncbi:unnamed protein product [Aphanomyces euteiches]
MRVLLSLVVAATAVLALNQEQVDEPIAIQDSRALSAAFGGVRGGEEADIDEADETLRVLKATGRRRGRFPGMGRPFGFGGGAPPQGGGDADETLRVLKATGRRRGGRGARRRGGRGARRGRPGGRGGRRAAA